MTTPVSVSIVIPAKDEEQTLPTLLKDLAKVTQAIPDHTFEVIVVNDHSKDKTAEVCRSAGARLVDNLRDPGKGNALISGFEQAQGKIFIMMDADYSHRPEDIPGFLENLAKGHGLVVGSRSTGGSDEYTLIRTLGNVGLSAVFRLMTGVQISDVLNGYKAFYREIFTSYPYKCAEFEIEIELMVNTLRRGQTVGEFACHERSRAGGEAKSQVIRHGTRFLWAIVSLAGHYQVEKLFKKPQRATT